MDRSSELLGGEVVADSISRLLEVIRPEREVGGWGTVDLDRAVVEVSEGPDRKPAAVAPDVQALPDDRLLGARCRLLRAEPHPDILLLEPSTEGPLAAALARHGEGWLVRYALADAGAYERARRAGFGLGNEGFGPFGRQRLVRLEPRWGPYVVITVRD